MSEQPQLVVRLLETPDIARIVPRLPPLVFNRMIERYGIEGCADLVALATPAQLRRVLDVDLWRPPAAGGDEAFDGSRFGEWIEALMDADEALAADRLAAMDLDLAIAGLSDHLRVSDGAVSAPYEMLDGTEVAGWTPRRDDEREIGGFLVEARKTSAWHPIVDLLVHLQEARPAFFVRLMRGCIAVSSAGREVDGCDALLDERGQQRSDLAINRETRRDREGYLAPAQARAFLRTARTVRLDAEPPEQDPILRAALREMNDAAAIEPEPGPGLAPDVPAVAAVMQILLDEGLVTPPRALLTGATLDDDRLGIVRAFAESYSSTAEELAFLANALLSGCALQRRAFTAEQASDAVLATCNLGLENWPRTWPARDLVTAFQIGWSLLHQDVCRYSAQVLADVLDGIVCSDRETQWSLRALRRELLGQLPDGEPWRVREALDAILALDATAWTILAALLDECPTLHAALTTPRLRTIDPDAVTFAARNVDIALARRWLTQLAAVLVG